MKLGVATACFSHMSLEETLRYLAPFGFDCIEPSAGGMLSRTHADPALLLGSSLEFDRYRDLLARHHVTISNLKAHGNLVHPNPDIARAHREDFERAILLSEKLGLKYIHNFSGCPGAPDGGRYPNWVVQPFPLEFREIYEYQWNEVLIPFWQEMVRFAADHGIEKIGIEMHPGFSVYNPESFLKLRDAVGGMIACCFDPAHLMPQGIDPTVAIRALGRSICHVHAKDSGEHPHVIALNGRFDPKMYTRTDTRAWLYRTLGYGHDAKTWRDILSALAMAGYDGVVNLEHDDCLLTTVEGFEKAAAFMQRIFFREKASGLWWNHH
jgi:sugar phosphate isomerase/epimerase